MTYDFNDNDIDGTGLSGDEFKKRLDNMPGRLVAILDACHSGAVSGSDKPPAQADSLVRDLTAEDSGVIVMCASLGREYAAESKLTKAGFFTLGLVEGMSGHGDVDGDGVVYIHELDMYAKARVQQLSGGRQNPALGRAVHGATVPHCETVQVARTVRYTRRHPPARPLRVGT